MRPRKLILIAVALAALLAPGLAGCVGSSGAATSGPLGGAARGGGICAPGRIGKPITFGLERFRNDGTRALTFDRVRLRDPHGLRLVGAYAAPGVSWLVGAGFSWPPRSTKGFPLPPTWKHRQVVHGFRLAPGKSVNMVLGVAATTTPRGYTPGMEIWYRDPAGRYTWSITSFWRSTRNPAGAESVLSRLRDAQPEWLCNSFLRSACCGPAS